MGKAIVTVRPSFTNQQLNAIIPNKSVDPDFLYYALVPWRDQLLSLGASTGVRTPILNKSAFSDLRIQIPPLPTQRKIAAILSAYDDLIENDTRRIAILEAMARLIYREWFVHFHFPGHEGVRLVESEVGPVPEGWEVIRFSNLLDSFLGGDWGQETPTEKEDYPVKVIRGTDFKDVELGNELRTPTRYITGTSATKRKLRDGDVIVENSVNATSRCVGSSLLITQESLAQIGTDVICASFCKNFRPQNSRLGVLIDLHLKYLYHENKMPFYQVVATNGIGNFQASRFVESEALVLPKNQDFQDYLLDSLWDLHSLKFTLAAKNAYLRRTRDLLLPRLISGEVEVAALEIEHG